MNKWRFILGCFLVILTGAWMQGCGNKNGTQAPATTTATDTTPNNEIVDVKNPNAEAHCECDKGLIVAARAEDDENKGLPPLNERTVTPAKRMKKVETEPARAARLKAVTGQKVFFGNLHSHTKYSDGSDFPKNAYEHARDVAKLDFLALTEHNHQSANQSETFGIAFHNDRYEGPRADGLIPVANTLTVDDTFVALYGQEFSSISSGNHLCVFDVPHVIDSNSVPNGAFDKLLNDWLPNNLDTQGAQAIVQLNHPWSADSPNSKEYGRDDFSSFNAWRDKLGARAHLIEVINGPSHSTGTGLAPATIDAGEFRRYLNLGLHLAPTANQDNHHETWGSITDARTGVIAPRLTKSDILTALRERHVYASLDKNLKIIAFVETKLCGSILTDAVADEQELKIEISFEDSDEPTQAYWVEVFADKSIDGESGDERATVVATFGPMTTSNDPNESNVFEITGLKYKGWDYIYFRIREGSTPSNTQEQAWLAPVWFP